MRETTCDKIKDHLKTNEPDRIHLGTESDLEAKPRGLSDDESIEFNPVLSPGKRRGRAPSWQPEKQLRVSEPATIQKLMSFDKSPKSLTSQTKATDTVHV